jgi:hypothetical protein
MRVGDLVELSAKGKLLKGNSDFVGEVGVVLEVMGNGYYDLGIRWFSKRYYSHSRVTWFKRYEIKKIKADKKCP